MELELISTELRPFKLSHLAAFCNKAYNQLLVLLFEGFFSYFVNILEHNKDMHKTF